MVLLFLAKLNPFTGRSQRPIPLTAESVLEKIPARFKDDGCSSSPDSLFGFEFRWACRIHDWRYCTRCHRAGSMTQAARRRGDEELGGNIRSTLPWRWRWVRWIYQTVVRRHGGTSAFDSCGPVVGKVCRHNMSPPSWMFIKE